MAAATIQQGCLEFPQYHRPSEDLPVRPGRRPAHFSSMANLALVLRQVARYELGRGGRASPGLEPSVAQYSSSPSKHPLFIHHELGRPAMPEQLLAIAGLGRQPSPSLLGQASVVLSPTHWAVSAPWEETPQVLRQRTQNPSQSSHDSSRRQLR